ncbi:hypothetical protein KP509_10G031300 [Ceratopteris richardii]|uniref:Uncharacterized protein n=1 Tax=Ceratopteris richardii TaxID=49495 RepID=A0A8T2TZN7_CERRI|nr:hypothetical protein KP509_10G031300 [Ceratopteris richardii]
MNLKPASGSIRTWKRFRQDHVDSLPLQPHFLLENQATDDECDLPSLQQYSSFPSNQATYARQVRYAPFSNAQVTGNGGPDDQANLMALQLQSRNALRQRQGDCDAAPCQTSRSTDASNHSSPLGAITFTTSRGILAPFIIGICALFLLVSLR